MVHKAPRPRIETQLQDQMRFKHWFYIILIQIFLVAAGLFLYHLFLGGTGIDPGDAITIWATVKA